MIRRQDWNCERNSSDCLHRLLPANRASNPNIPSAKQQLYMLTFQNLQMHVGNWSKCHLRPSNCQYRSFAAVAWNKGHLNIEGVIRGDQIPLSYPLRLFNRCSTSWHRRSIFRHGATKTSAKQSKNLADPFILSLNPSRAVIRCNKTQGMLRLISVHPALALGRTLSCTLIQESQTFTLCLQSCLKQFPVYISSPHKLPPSIRWTQQAQLNSWVGNPFPSKLRGRLTKIGSAWSTILHDIFTPSFLHLPRFPCVCPKGFPFGINFGIINFGVSLWHLSIRTPNFTKTIGQCCNWYRFCDQVSFFSHLKCLQLFAAVRSILQQMIGEETVEASLFPPEFDCAFMAADIRLHSEPGTVSVGHQASEGSTKTWAANHPKKIT